MPDPSALTRYATLQRLGVTLWVPRKQLPGAAPSQVCDWPQPVRLGAKERLWAELPPRVPQAPQQTPQPVPQPASQQTPQPAPQQTAAEVVPLLLQEQAQEQEQTTAPSMPVALARAAPLQVDVWVLANGWQLVAEHSGQQPLTQEAITLAQNLIRALYPGPIGLVSQHHFSWPLAGVPLDQGDDQELALSLAAFLTGAQFQRPAVALLLLGERLPKLLEQVAHLPLPEQYAAPGLGQLLQQPTLKQQFWQQAGARGLRARFASSPLLWS